MNIKMGLIGAGRMGKVFAHALAFTVAGVDLVAVADADPKTSEEVATRFGAKYHYSDCELLKREDIDAVVIATSTSTLALTRQCIRHDTTPGFMERFKDAYAAEICAFVACILENRAPGVTGEDARKATAIGMAATLSLDEVRPVMISEVG